MKQNKLIFQIFFVTIVTMTSSFVYKDEIVNYIGNLGGERIVPLQADVVGSTALPTLDSDLAPTSTPDPAPTPTPDPAPTSTTDRAPTPTTAPAPNPAPTQPKAPLPNSAPAPAPKPAPAPSPAPSKTTDQQLMLDLINRERSKVGVAPLKFDSKLQKMAQVKSDEMVAKSYFSHTSPTYDSPFDMMKKFGIGFTAAGENIAGNSSVEKAHAALMNSPGHKENILKSSFNYIGIGITASPTYGKMFAQEFIGR